MNVEDIGGKLTYNVLQIPEGGDYEAQNLI